MVVGAAFFPSSGIPEARAVRWNGTTIEQLGALAGYRRSWAFAVSQDGSVVVGYAIADDDASPSTSIRWVNGQPQNLGWLPINGADGSIAYGVSGDGTIVVGNSDGRAYRWTPANGMENLNVVYASLLTDGSTRAVPLREWMLTNRSLVGEQPVLLLLNTEGASPLQEGEAINTSFPEKKPACGKKKPTHNLSNFRNPTLFSPKWSEGPRFTPKMCYNTPSVRYTTKH